MPLHSLYKKKGSTFAFLNFNSEEDMKDFAELFYERMPKENKEKFILRPVNNI